MADVVTLSRAQFESLLDKALMMEALQEAGVDNWEGYDFALTLLEENQNS